MVRHLIRNAPIGRYVLFFFFFFFFANLKHTNPFEIVWTAFTAEGFGASLQHYNFLPPLVEKIKEDYNLPKDWKLKAQLVFGTPVGGPMDKTTKPLEDRVKVFGK